MLQVLGWFESRIIEKSYIKGVCHFRFFWGGTDNLAGEVYDIFYKGGGVRGSYVGEWCLVEDVHFPDA